MPSVLRQCVFVIGLILVVPDSLQANPAEDGDIVVSSGTVTLNAYTTLSASVVANASSFTVASTAALTLPTCPGTATCTGATIGNGAGSALALGDLLMLYQPQELSGSINTTDGVAYGTVTDQGQAGLYEFVYVQSVVGSTVTIVSNAGGDPCTGLKNGYDAGAMVIRIPQLRNLTINGGSVVAPAWNGSVGGVVALDVRPGAPPGPDPLPVWVANNGTVAINVANGIDLNGRGFRGGAIDNVTDGTGTNVTTYRSGLCAAGARKGESILGFAGTNNTNCNTSGGTANDPTGVYVGNTATGNAFSRGAIANGGGGGNAHNAGGGGGANGGTAAWTGGGNPRSGFNAAWNRDDNTADPNDSPTVTASSTSSGGGRGGYTFSADNQDALAVAPGCNSHTDLASCGGTPGPDWGGNDRRNRGGLGGRPLSRGTDRFYFGGGGGAGDGNNGVSAAGGAGGGLLFLIAQRVTSTQPAATVLIRANGAAGANTTGSHNDAPGGGGGGGTVVLQIANGLQGTIQANGGAGGNQLITNNEAEGPGGGGGGGVIAASSASGSPTFVVDGGVSGTTSSASLAEFTPNGATNGGAGEIVAAPGSSNAVYQCMIGDGGAFTTPSGHGYFHGRAVGNGRLRVDFASTYELGNAAYYLEGERAGAIERIGGAIARKPGEAESARSYSVDVPDRDWQRFWLVEVDAKGGSRRRGPFFPGRAEGSPNVDHRYDWSMAQSEHLAYVQQRQRGASTAAAYLEVAQAGMHRVSFEQLLAAGIDLTGIPADELALSDRLGPVMRRVAGGSVFGPGSAIEFYGDPQPDLYKRTQTYLLQRSSQPSDIQELRIIDRGEVNGAPIAQASPAMAESHHVPPNHFYDPVSPNDSPWYMYELFASAGSPASQTMNLAAPGAVGGSGRLRVELSGFVNLPAGAQPDHHVRVYLNDVLVADDRFDGIIPRLLDVPVNNVAVDNVVRVELPGDTGFDFDMIAIHSVGLRYGTLAQVSGGRFVGSGLTSVGERSDRFFADSFGDALPVFEEGIPVEQQVVIAGRTSQSRIFVVSPRTVTELSADPDRALNGSYADSPSSVFWVGDTAQMVAPAISAAPPLVDFQAGTARWLAIAHGMFLSQAEQLATYRSAQGLSARVMSVEQLYRRYTAGNAHPSAIERFLREQASTLQVEYLVLFGGANYNSVDLRGTGVATLSHVPTRYARTNRFVNFAPTDTPYGDLTGDGLPEIKVGRLPVRTVAEANEAVRKLIAYESQSATEKILLSSGTYDSNFSYSFMGSATQLQAALPSGWLSTRADVEASGLSGARSALLDAINQGRSIITYTGHSSPINWDAVGGGSSLLSVDDLIGLPVNANQPLVFQFGCWTTYFVSPVINAMGNALVLTPNRGASAVLGSTVLLDQPNHDRLAAALGPRLQSEQRLGDVFESARQALSTTEGPLDGAELRLGMTLLGDPATLVR